MVSSTNYLDLWSFFVNDVIGDVKIFAIISLLIIFYVSNKYDLDYKSSWMFIIIFTGILYSQYYESLTILFVIILLIVSFMLYLNGSKVLTR